MGINGTVAGTVNGASLTNRRGQRRKSVLWPVRLDTEGGSIACTAFDVSLSGAKLRLEGKVALNRPVLLVIERCGAFHAETVWQRGSLLGLRFTEPPERVRERLDASLPL